MISLIRGERWRFLVLLVRWVVSEVGNTEGVSKFFNEWPCFASGYFGPKPFWDSYVQYSHALPDVISLVSTLKHSTASPSMCNRSPLGYMLYTWWSFRTISRHSPTHSHPQVARVLVQLKPRYDILGPYSVPECIQSSSPCKFHNNYALFLTWHLLHVLCVLYLYLYSSYYWTSLSRTTLL